MARITVEDCLKKIPSRFALVHVASERGRELLKGRKALVTTDNKAVVTALREVAAGVVILMEEKPRKLKGLEEGKGSPEA